MTHSHAPLLGREATPDPARRLDDIGWAVFLILTGVIWLFPDAQIPPGTWLLCTGALLLGLNLVRAIIKVPVSGFTITLGILAVAAGLSALWGVRVPLAAICLILLGSGMLARQLFKAR